MIHFQFTRYALLLATIAVLLIGENAVQAEPGKAPVASVAVAGTTNKLPGAPVVVGPTSSFVGPTSSANNLHPQTTDGAMKAAPNLFGEKPLPVRVSPEQAQNAAGLNAKLAAEAAASKAAGMSVPPANPIESLGRFNAQMAAETAAVRAAVRAAARAQAAAKLARKKLLNTETSVNSNSPAYLEKKAAATLMSANLDKKAAQALVEANQAKLKANLAREKQDVIDKNMRNNIDPKVNAATAAAVAAAATAQANAARASYAAGQRLAPKYSVPQRMSHAMQKSRIYRFFRRTRAGQWAARQRAALRRYRMNRAHNRKIRKELRAEAKRHKPEVDAFIKSSKDHIKRMKRAQKDDKLAAKKTAKTLQLDARAKFLAERKEIDRKATTEINDAKNELAVFIKDPKRHQKLPNSPQNMDKNDAPVSTDQKTRNDDDVDAPVTTAQKTRNDDDINLL